MTQTMNYPGSLVNAFAQRRPVSIHDMRTMIKPDMDDGKNNQVPWLKCITMILYHLGTLGKRPWNMLSVCCCFVIVLNFFCFVLDLLVGVGTCALGNLKGFQYYDIKVLYIPTSKGYAVLLKNYFLTAKCEYGHYFIMKRNIILLYKQFFC